MSKHLRNGSATLAAALLFTAGPVLSQETRISGLFFGDYYATVGHHDADVENTNGFWARRMYLTVDTKLDAGWDARVRFEANSPGDFESTGKMEPFLKDLWVRWNRGRHSILLGLSSSPTWDVPEKLWGYRDLEKTPLDLAKLGSSRDFGIAFKGAFDEAKKVEYHFMLGNGSATKGETNQGKKFAGAIIFHPTSKVTIHAYADHEDRTGPKNRNTLEIFGGINGEKGRVGLMWARQTREQASGPDLDIDVISGFAVLDASERVNLVVRVDRLLDPNPDGGKISYFGMDPTSESTFFLAGVDIELGKGVHLIPNLEFVTYDDASLDSDVFLKTTFSIKF
jgi:hypothetical protein